MHVSCNVGVCHERMYHERECVIFLSSYPRLNTNRFSGLSALRTKTDDCTLCESAWCCGRFLYYPWPSCRRSAPAIDPSSSCEYRLLVPEISVFSYCIG